MKQTFWARRRKIPLLSYFSCAATQCWLSFTYAQCKVANILGRVLEHEFWTAFHGQPRNSERRHQLLALQEAVPWPGFPIFVFKQVLEQSCWSRAAFLQGPGSGAQSSGQGGHRWAPGCSLASAVCGLHQAGTHHRRAAALPGALPAGKPDSTRNRSFHSGISHWNPCSWKASCSLFWKSSWKLHPVHPWREGGACQWHWAQAGTAGTAPVHLGFNCSDCPQSLSGEMQNWGTALLLSTGISWKITHNNRLSSSQRAIHFLVWL